MLYLTEKSSAPATVRRSTSARIAARSRRIARRAAARVQRAARIADTHTAPAAVLITPITPAARIAAMLITDDITGRFTRHAAAVAVARVYPRPVLTRTNGGYCYIQPDGPAYLAPVDMPPHTAAPPCLIRAVRLKVCLYRIIPVSKPPHQQRPPHPCISPAMRHNIQCTLVLYRL